MSVYEAPPDGGLWAIIVCMFLVAAVVIGYIFAKIGQGKK